MTAKDRIRLEMGRLKMIGRTFASGLRERVAHLRDRKGSMASRKEPKNSLKQRNMLVFALEILFVTIVAYFWM